MRTKGPNKIVLTMPSLTSSRHFSLKWLNSQKLPECVTKYEWRDRHRPSCGRPIVFGMRCPR